MGDLLSLSRARKARERVAKEAQAAANRAAHGRMGAEKKAARIEGQRRESALDGARLDVPVIHPGKGKDPATGHPSRSASHPDKPS